MSGKNSFDPELVRAYPKSNKKIPMQVSPYKLKTEKDTLPESSYTVFISPHGLEFHSPQEYPTGMLLRIQLEVPDYWQRKKQFVEYNRIDIPASFNVLARVMKSENMGKGKKRSILVQTVNMEDIDTKILQIFLDEKFAAK